MSAQRRFLRSCGAIVASIVALSGCTVANTPGWTYPAASSPVVTPAQTSATSAGPSSEAPSASTAEPTPESTGSPTSQGPIAIYVSEWGVGLPTSVLAGSINFAITNIGTIQHELLVFKSALSPSAYPLDKNGDIVEDGPGITLVSDGENIDPGKTQTRTVDLTQPGTYLFVCNIPGHFKAGMFRVVTVTPPAAQQAYIPAALSEWHIAAPSTIKAGSIILEAGNFGTIPHEILVFKSDLGPSAYPLDKKGDIVEDGPGITLVSDGENIDPGKTQTRTVDLAQPGTYLFVCNIPGHFKAGMFSVITVTP